MPEPARDGDDKLCYSSEASVTPETGLRIHSPLQSDGLTRVRIARERNCRHEVGKDKERSHLHECENEARLRRLK